MMLYWLTIKAYAIAVRMAAWVNPKARLFVNGRKQLLQHIHQSLQNEQRPRIWMHCASLGEFEQGRPILEKLRLQYPGHALVLTFFSPSGYEVRKDYTGVDYVFYLPLDSNKHATRFLDIVQPALCIFVKYELWYYYLKNIADKNIKAILVSAIFRESQPFFKWYGGLHRAMLRCFKYIFVQDAASQKLLTGIGITNVAISGDTRFDRVIEVAQQPMELPIASSFAQGFKIIVAGSTWPKDEVLLQKTLQQLPTHWRLIIAPHEIDDNHIADIEKLLEGNTIRWSQWQQQTDKCVLIVDNIGYLSALYRYATICWIGGGLDAGGIHNALEAAAYGKPCVYGPVYQKYIEAMQLIAAEGAVAINDAQELIAQIAAWENDNSQYVHASNAARQYVQANAGATAKIMNYISAQ